MIKSEYFLYKQGKLTEIDNGHTITLIKQYYFPDFCIAIEYEKYDKGLGAREIALIYLQQEYNKYCKVRGIE